MHIFDGFLNYKLYFCGFFVSLEKVKKIHQNKNPNFFILAFWVKKIKIIFEVFRFFFFFCVRKMEFMVFVMVLKDKIFALFDDYQKLYKRDL